MVCLVLGSIWISGCDEYQTPISQTSSGTSSGTSGSGITISLVPGGIVFVDVGKSRQVSASLASDPSNEGVNWTLSGPGSLSNVTTMSATYNAPTGQDLPATITATSVYDSSQVATATMYSVAKPTIPAATLSSGTVGLAYSAIVSAANGAVPFNWSLASGAGSLPPGLTFSQTSLDSTTIQGTPTQQGTFNFTVQVVDVCGSVASQSFSITIGAGSTSSDARIVGGNSMLTELAGGGVNNALLQGNYAFRFGGFGPQGMIASAGTLAADGNGNITSGIADRNSAAGAETGVAFTGTYAVGANQLGTMTLAFADGTSATYAIAVSSGGNARFIEFDDTTGLGTHGSGEMKKQDAGSLAAMAAAGNYAFELAGVDAQGGRLAIAGEFAVNAADAVSQGVLDANDAGVVANQLPLSGNYAASAKGAGSAEMDVPGTGTVHLNLYAVSADEAYAVETDGAGMPLLTGSVLRQSGGPFTNATFAGNDVAQMTGFAGGATQMIFGLLSADGSGNASLSAAQLAGGDVAEMDATYATSVGVGGRAALGPAAGSPIIYFVGPNQGFVLGTDSSVMAGWIQPQAGGPIAASSFSGTIAGASVFPASAGLTQSVVTLAFDGNGNVTGTGATSGANGLAVLPIQQGTYSVGAADIFLSVTWPPQNSQPMLIVSSGKLIVVPPGASFAPIVVQK